MNNAATPNYETHFEKYECTPIRDEGQLERKQVKDPEDASKVLQEAEPARAAWPSGFTFWARPYMNGFDFEALEKLTDAALDPANTSADYRNIMRGYASCALLIEYVDGNPFPSFANHPYPEDKLGRVRYFQKMPTSVALYVAQEVGKLGQDPFAFLKRAKGSSSDSAPASTRDYAPE